MKRIMPVSPYGARFLNKVVPRRTRLRHFDGAAVAEGQIVRARRQGRETVALPEFLANKPGVTTSGRYGEA